MLSKFQLKQRDFQAIFPASYVGNGACYAMMKQYPSIIWHHLIQVVIEMLSIKNVEKNYGKRKAVNNISLTIPKGSCYGIVGPNGAGKTTFLKIVASILPDYSGEVTFEEKVTIGYVPQEICLEPSLSAISNLQFFGELYGLKGSELHERMKEVLEDIGLTNRGKDKVKNFSGGMKRRLNIGCALINQPTLLILDEPTVGIDPQSRQFIFHLIHQLREKSCTILYASHYMEEVEQLCDSIAFFDNGELIEDGKVDTLLKKHGESAVFIQGDDVPPSQLGEIGNLSSHQQGYLMSGDNPLHMMKAIIGMCEENAWQMKRLELLQPSLEDIFFKLTGSELRDHPNQRLGGKSV